MLRTALARFDVKPQTSHVARNSPHLNLQSSVSYGGASQRLWVNYHIPIDPSSILPGDYGAAP
jgi:hypothetical protein